MLIFFNIIKNNVKREIFYDIIIKEREYDIEWKIKLILN